jgi:DNA-binding transcriptional LysR family regulator
MNAMNSRHLALFLTTARTANLTRAAGELGLGQPTASRWLQALAEEVGGRLFERSKEGLLLTPLGRAFLPYAERSVRAIEDGMAHAQQVRDGRAGRLVIGCSEVTSTYYLPDVLEGFADVCPEVDIRVQTGSAGATTASVAARGLELALVSSDPANPALEALLLDADAHVFVAASSDPLTLDAGVELARVAERGVILYSIGEPSGPYGLGPFVAAHLNPRIAMEVDTIETAKRMVMGGFGVALLPRMAVAEDLDRGRLEPIDVAVELGHWHVRAVRRINADQSGPAAAFWDWCLSRSEGGHGHE